MARDQQEFQFCVRYAHNTTRSKIPSPICICSCIITEFMLAFALYIRSIVFCVRTCAHQTRIRNQSSHWNLYCCSQSTHNLLRQHSRSAHLALQFPATAQRPVTAQDIKHSSAELLATHHKQIEVAPTAPASCTPSWTSAPAAGSLHNTVPQQSEEQQHRIHLSLVHSHAMSLSTDRISRLMFRFHSFACANPRTVGQSALVRQRSRRAPAPQGRGASRGRISPLFLRGFVEVFGLLGCVNFSAAAP